MGVSGMAVLLGEEEVRHRGSDGHRPAEARHQAGSPEVGHREDVERAADGEISEQVEIDYLCFDNCQDCTFPTRRTESSALMHSSR